MKTINRFYSGIALSLSGLLMVSNAVSQQPKDTQMAQSFTAENAENVYVHGGMWLGVNLLKNTPEIAYSKADWTWKNINPEQNDTPQFTQHQNNLPSDFSGTRAELKNIRDQFSLHKPKSTWLEPGKPILRKNMKKPKVWKMELKEGNNQIEGIESQ